MPSQWECLLWLLRPYVIAVIAVIAIIAVIAVIAPSPPSPPWPSSPSSPPIADRPNTFRSAISPPAARLGMGEAPSAHAQEGAGAQPA